MFQSVFSETLGALIGIDANGQGIMPFEVEGELFDRLLIREIEGLLHEHLPQHRVELCGQCSIFRRVKRQNLIHWKIR